MRRSSHSDTGRPYASSSVWPNAAASSRDLYAAYKLWCEDNAYNALSMKSFCNFLGQNAGTYHIEPTNNIYIGNGKRSRGFTGLKVVTKQF